MSWARMELVPFHLPFRFQLLFPLLTLPFTHLCPLLFHLLFLPLPLHPHPHPPPPLSHLHHHWSPETLHLLHPPPIVIHPVLIFTYGNFSRNFLVNLNNLALVSVGLTEVKEFLKLKILSKWPSYGDDEKIDLQWITINYPDQFDNIIRRESWKRQKEVKGSFINSVHLIVSKLLQINHNQQQQSAHLNVYYCMCSIIQG